MLFKFKKAYFIIGEAWFVSIEYTEQVEHEKERSDYEHSKNNKQLLALYEYFHFSVDLQ